MKLRLVLAAGGLSALAAAALAQQAPAGSPPMSAEEMRRAAASFLGSGYLGREKVPDSLLLNPPPPARGTVAQIRDEEAAGAAVTLRGSPRWELAKRDADLFSPLATDTFSCATGFALSPQTTPKLHSLLRKAAADLAVGSYATKNQYKRQRPFMVNGEPTCTPQDEPMLRQDGSYPSGHSAIGFGWGLLLAEIVPDRSAQLVSRGRAFGDSRRVCNVHWLSDVEEGRIVATAVVARLHAEPAFQKDLKAAQKEVAKQRRRLPAADCTAESAALVAR